jgi:hypothetical protein
MKLHEITAMAFLAIVCSDFCLEELLWNHCSSEDSEASIAQLLQSVK